MRDSGCDSNAPAVTAFPGELLIWLSASFPVGGFAYSQGLETAVCRDWVRDRETLAGWLAAVLAHGALRNDLVLVSLIMRATDRETVAAVAELAMMLQPSAERHGEAAGQGLAFVQAFEAAWCDDGASPFADLSSVTLPVALAIAARRHGIRADATLEGYGIANLNNLISAAIRLGVIGQFDGQRVMACLLPRLRIICERAMTATEDDLGSATYGADLASMLHETQTTRLFRS